MPCTVSPRARVSSENNYGHHVPGDTGKHIPTGPLSAASLQGAVGLWRAECCLTLGGVSLASFPLLVPIPYLNAPSRGELTPIRTAWGFIRVSQTLRDRQDIVSGPFTEERLWMAQGHPT